MGNFNIQLLKKSKTYDLLAKTNDELVGFNNSEQTLKDKIAVINQRIANLLTNLGELPESSAELMDIRVAYDGTIYPSAGDAVRSQFESLFSNKDFDSIEFDEETRMLRFLDADGNDVFEPVNIPGGGGGSGDGSGGGGGNNSSSVVKLLNNNGTSVMNVAAGSPVELIFTFTSTDDDVPTGNGTCEIIANGVTMTNFSIAQGQQTYDVTKWLKPGSNTIKVKCTDVYGNYKILLYSISVVDLYITSTFDDSITYDSDIAFKFIPFGNVEKTIHIVLDDTEINTVTTSESGKQRTTMIPKQSHGVHRLSIHATALVGDVEVSSPKLLFDIMCLESENNEVIISSAFGVEEATQGEQISIPYSIYDPTALTAQVELKVLHQENEENIVYSTQTLTVDRLRQYWNTRKYPVGIITFQISSGGTVVEHVVTVKRASVDIEPTTEDLELHLSSVGRNNNEESPEIWSYQNITTKFTNVNWGTTGWVTNDEGDTVLRLNGEARAEINFKPFENDLKMTGKTIEIEFEVQDVNNREAVVIECMDENIGFFMTADTATLKSEQSTISTHFFEGNKVRISFVVEKRTEYRLLQIYVNGVLSGAKQYPIADNFQQKNPVNIKIGSSQCSIDIYSIRCYSGALTFTEITHNYIADIEDVTEKRLAFEANDIYDEYGGISYEIMKEKIPVMTIIGDLPQSKGDKKNVSVKFEHNTDSTLNWSDTASIDVQGTSSQWYIRKNYKIKNSEEHIHVAGNMPSKVFCTKADYAESTGTFNTQNANLVHTLYSEKTPAQEADERCRTTVLGYPIVIFHQKGEGETPEFIGKYNLNYDKGSVDVYGFDGTFDAESWEFLNNTSDACNFLGPVTQENFSDNFEARYPEDCEDITRFKIMHDWVVSTKDNLEKFRNEFEDHFDLHYTLIYYIYSSVMLMVDQRAKNMFLTYWADTNKWQPWFYDNDTCMGINNEGQLTFDYFHEDIDQLDGANIYNGQNSVLWTNFREAFTPEIKAMYQQLRSNKKLTKEIIFDYFINRGSKKWSASIYNEDSDYKYISMLRSDNDSSNLYQIRGTGEQHIRYFISNRINYFDSKWYATDYANDYVSLRIYTPETYKAVEPNADITVLPFSNMYAGVMYKANGTLVQKRVETNKAVTFVAPDETFNDTETAIYGASQLSSLGDLAPLYCGTINVSKATRLVHLKIGDEQRGYSNPNLTDLSVGTNRLLRTIDVRNCPNLTHPLALSGCPNIQEIYATGTSITGVELPESGYIKVLHLPETITNLTIKDQRHIEDFEVDSYENLRTLNLEKCPSIDVFEILDNAPNLERARLVNMGWSFSDTSYLYDLYNRGIGGIDDQGYNTDTITISGTCKVQTANSSDLVELKKIFPYLEVETTYLSHYIIFMSADGKIEYFRINVDDGENGYDPVVTGKIPTPTKAQTGQYTYTYNGGWSTTMNGEPEEDILKNVKGPLVLYPTFTAAVRNYQVRFLDYRGTVLQSETLQYGETPVFKLDQPESHDPSEYEFSGWDKEIVPVTESIDYKVTLRLIGSEFRALVKRTIAGTYINDRITTLRYAGIYSCNRLKKVDLGNITTINNYNFRKCYNLEAVILRSESLCTLVATGNIESKCKVYVPKNLLQTYKNATNWSTVSNKIFAIEDYPEICERGDI